MGASVSLLLLCAEVGALHPLHKGMGAVSSKMKVGYTGCLELLNLLNGPRRSWAGECAKELEIGGIKRPRSPVKQT